MCIRDRLEPTKGDIVITPGQRLSFLQQDHFKYDAYTVLDTVIMGNLRLYEIMKEKEAIYAKEDFTDEDGIRASELEGEFAEMNGWEAESDAATLLNGLGIDTEFHYAPVSYTHLFLQSARPDESSVSIYPNPSVSQLPAKATHRLTDRNNKPHYLLPHNIFLL